jgi:hypothetical protein
MIWDAPTSSLIRVLVVDDSAFMRNFLSRMITCESGLEVATRLCKRRAIASGFERVSFRYPTFAPIERLPYFPQQHSDRERLR